MKIDTCRPVCGRLGGAVKRCPGQRNRPAPDEPWPARACPACARDARAAGNPCGDRMKNLLAGLAGSALLAGCTTAVAPPVRLAPGRVAMPGGVAGLERSEEHTSELQSLMRISYAVFCLKKKNTKTHKK